jgi:hypothetical protein
MRDAALCGRTGGWRPTREYHDELARFFDHRLGRES